MATKTQYEPRIERGITRLIVPHENSEIVFVYPFIGPNNYPNVGAEILNQGYGIPTGDEIASLLHAVYCSESKDEPEFEKIRKIMRNNWLWVFNRNLWTDKGVYVIQDSTAKGRSESINENGLEKMLQNGEEINGVIFSEDKQIRFAPKETHTLGDQTPEQLSRNGFIVASYGKEGAEKLGEIAAKFEYNPYLWGLNITKRNSQELRVSALGGDGGDGLRVYSYDFGDDRGGHSFGVLN